MISHILRLLVLILAYFSLTCTFWVTKEGANVTPSSETCSAIQFIRNEYSKSLYPTILNGLESLDSILCPQKISNTQGSYFAQISNQFYDFFKQKINANNYQFETTENSREPPKIDVILSNWAFFHIVLALLFSPFFYLSTTLFPFVVLILTCYFQQTPVYLNHLREGFWLALVACVLDFLIQKRRQRDYR